MAWPLIRRYDVTTRSIRQHDTHRHHTNHWVRRMASVTALVALAVAIPVSQASAGQASVVVKKANRGKFGTILVTSRGATLYRFSSDKPNMPTCTGSCAVAWPPLVLPAGQTSAHGGSGVSGLGTVTLPNGKRQVTFDKMPLYTFASDSGTSVTGQGVQGFFVVHPTKGTGTTSPTTSTTSPSSGGGYGY